MNYTQIETDVITANSFSQLSYNQKKYLVAANGGGDAQKYADRLIKTLGAGVYNKIREKFRDKSYRDKLLAGYDGRDVYCITIKSAGYPAQLLQVFEPPLVLYLRGNAKLLSDRALAVVGSRRSTPQALERCKRACSEISEKLTIVTGVADGADSAAIKGALASGRIICFLPGGHDSACSPDLQLVRSVEERGLTVSEYPPAVKAQRYTFTMRNRLMAGFADGVLVVSAGKKSGALSTANYAVDYGKDVFAVPYSPGVPSGVGCNSLIKSGAFLCDSVEDIYGVLRIECGKTRTVGLEGDEKVIFDLLKEQGELHAEKIAAATQMTLTEVVTTCSMLEIKGMIVRTGGNTFAAI